MWHTEPNAIALIERIASNPTLEKVQAVAPLGSQAYQRGQWHVVSFIANSRGNPALYDKADQLRADLNELHRLRDEWVSRVMGCTFYEAEADSRAAVLEWIKVHSATLSPDDVILARVDGSNVIDLAPVLVITPTRVAA